MTGCREQSSATIIVFGARAGGPWRHVRHDRIVDERVPADGIRRHREVIGPLSDDELIARIQTLEPLPDADDDDPAWLEDATWTGQSSCSRPPMRLASGASSGRLPRCSSEQRSA